MSTPKICPYSKSCQYAKDCPHALRHQLRLIEQHAARHAEQMESEARQAKLTAALARQRLRRAQASATKAVDVAQESLHKVLLSQMPGASRNTVDITLAVLQRSRLLTWPVSLLPWYDAFMQTFQ